MELYPTISIVTPSFNQGEFIEETMLSVLSQQGDFFIDYIIMDGGSTDTTLDVIKKFDQLLNSDNWLISCKGIRFRWVSERDGGQSDAINKGFDLAQGTILGWLNSDDVYYSGTFQLVASLNWQKIDFCYGEGMWISRNGKDLCLYPTFRPSKYAFYFHCTLCQPTVFFNMNVLRELGSFSLEYHCSFDYEYWLRAVMNNKRFEYVDALIAQSRMYPQNKSLFNQKTVQVEIEAIKKKYFNSNSVNPVIKAYFRLSVSFRTYLRNATLQTRLKAEDKSLMR